MKKIDKLNIVLLSSWGSDVTAWSKPILEIGYQIKAIIMDGDTSNPKNDRIISVRTGGLYSPLSITNLEEFYIPVYFVKNHNNRHSLKLVKSLSTDILINAGTPRIIKPSLLRAPKIGVLNCHPSLLPKYRGCTAVEWALYFGDKLGATCHFMNSGIDSGKIIYQEELLFSATDSYEAIRTKMIYHSAQVMAKGVKLVIDKKLLPSKLPPQASSKYYSVIDLKKVNSIRKKYPFINKH